jgi:hypothetical protein
MSEGKMKEGWRKDGGRMKAGRRKVGGRSEEGRRKVGGRSEEFYLNWQSDGLQISKFKSYLSKKIMKICSEFQTYFQAANLQRKIQFVMKKLGDWKKLAKWRDGKLVSSV